MNKQIYKEIKEELIQVLDLMSILKSGLNNMNKPLNDTVPYAVLASVIEEKISNAVDGM